MPILSTVLPSPMGKMGHTERIFFGIPGPAILVVAYDADEFEEEYIMDAWEQSRGAI
jgi:hypothetical protein